MMRKVFSVALMATLACAFGLVQSANAGVTIDLHFQDQTLPTGITIMPGDAGPGCTFTGYYKVTVTQGYCMDVMITSSWDLTAMQGSVHYDTDNGLSVASFYEWKGVGVSWDAKDGTLVTKCGNLDGITDSGTQIDWFECSLLPPVNPPSVPAGTYRLGTIIWNTSGTFLFDTNQEVLSVVSAIAGVIINGAIVDVTGQVVTGSHILNIIPEPGTAALLGLGLVGLVLAGRRRRA